MTDKREQILTVAEKLFGDNGYDGTSVRDIAQHAKVNLAMISYYFGSKEKLLETLLEFRANTTVLQDLNKDEILTPWEKMERVIDFYVERILNNFCFHNIMQQQGNNSRSAEIRELIIQIKLKNFEQIKKIITDGQRKKVFRKVDIEMTVGTVMGAITQLTQARHYWSRLLNVEVENDEVYRKKMIPRLKSHLKELLHAHLDIRNDQ